MKLRLDTTTALVRRLPVLHADNIRRVGGRQHVLKRQRFLSDTAFNTYEGKRQHSEDRRAVSLPRDYWTDGLSVTRYRYRPLAGLIFDFPQGNFGYSYTKHVSKPYRLTAEASEAVRAVLDSDEPLAVCCAETGAPVSVSQLPKDGLPSSAGLSFSVPSVLSLPPPDVDRAIATLERWSTIAGPSYPLNPDKLGGLRIEQALPTLRVVRQWTRAIGGLPNFYTLQHSGRLGPLDSSSPHVVSMPSMLRRLLFSGSGLVDYDLKACFWSLFCSLGKAYGFSTQYAENYLANRDHWFLYLRNITGARQNGPLKETLLSWLACGPLTTNPFHKPFQLFGDEGAERLCSSPVARSLHAEVQAGLHVIRERAPRVTLDGVSVPLNCLGLPLRAEKGRRPDAGEEASHLLTGYEQLVIRAMCSQVSGLQAVVYDGFVSPPQDVSALEQYAQSETERVLGFPLKVSLKATPFTQPEDPEADPADF